MGRTLHPNPDRVVDAGLAACPKCQAVFPETAQTPQQVYERIELPPIRPDVTQLGCSVVAAPAAASGWPEARLPVWPTKGGAM